jgi:hypothetical protein
MSRLRPGDVVAGVGGAVLFVSLFLHWYGFDAKPLIKTVGSGGTVDTQGLGGVAPITAWQAFSVVDILLAACALLAIAVPVVTALARGPAKPIALDILASCGGVLAVLLIVFRLIAQPGNDALIAVKGGAWIGLAGALIALAGAWWAMADERAPGAAPPRIPRRAAPR